MENQMEEKVIEILKKYSKKNQIDFTTKIEELGIDSLKMIQSIVDFEESFHIEFEVEKLSKDEFVIVKDLVQYILLKVKDERNV